MNISEEYNNFTGNGSYDEYDAYDYYYDLLNENGLSLEFIDVLYGKDPIAGKILERKECYDGIEFSITLKEFEKEIQEVGEMLKKINIFGEVKLHIFTQYT